MKFARTLAAIALLGSAGAAQAHFVWLERADQGPAKAYFGEWADDLREKRDGLLGKVLVAPVVTGADGKALKASAEGADFVEFATSGKGDVRLSQPIQFKDTLMQYGAKAGREDTQGKLDLELVPAAAGSNTFVLHLRASRSPRPKSPCSARPSGKSVSTATRTAASRSPRRGRASTCWKPPTSRTRPARPTARPIPRSATFPP